MLSINWGALLTTLFTGVTTVIGVLVYVNSLNRARKKDIMDVVEKKADKELVSKELEIRDVKIINMEKFLAEQNKHIREILEEQHAILESVQLDVRQIKNKAV